MISNRALNFKRYFVIALCFLPRASFGADRLSIQLAELTQKISENYKRTGKTIPVTVAVFNFETSRDLRGKRIGELTAEMMIHHLTQSKIFTVVERARIDKILKEQELGLMGYVDEETASKISKMLGARLLLLGSVTRLGERYQINTRLVDSESAEIVATGFLECRKETFDIGVEPYIGSLKSYTTYKKNQILFIGGSNIFIGDFSDAADGAAFGGLGYRRVSSNFGFELAGDYAMFKRKTSPELRIDADVALTKGIVSGLYYFGYPFQIRGYAKVGGGVARSALKADSVNKKIESDDMAGIFGLGIDLSRNRKIGGIIEINYQQIFLRGIDISSLGIILGITFNG